MLGIDKQRTKASAACVSPGSRIGEAEAPSDYSCISGKGLFLSDRPCDCSAESCEALAEHSKQHEAGSATTCHHLDGKRLSGLSQETFDVGREVSFLKRRLSLQPLVSGRWGCNLLERHSDLSAFTEELCSYSRGAAALCFLVLPFSPPRAEECPWEIGRQAPPRGSSQYDSQPSSLQSLEGAEGVSVAPADDWVTLENGVSALEMRILLRECFVATSGSRDAGVQGHMAMKVRKGTRVKRMNCRRFWVGVLLTYIYLHIHTYIYVCVFICKYIYVYIMH